MNFNLIVLLLIVIMIITASNIDNEQAERYKYKVEDSHGHYRGYTNSEPKNGCILIDSKHTTLCGNFELHEN